MLPLRFRALLLLASWVFLSQLSCRGDSETNLETVRGDSDSLSYAQADRLTGFAVQLAAFNDFENARRFAQKIEASGLPAYVQPATDSTTLGRYRVRVGPYSSREEAQAAVERSKELGYADSYLVPERMRHDGTLSEDQSDQPEPKRRKLTITGQSRAPQWSPTGREIAFYKEEDGTHGLYTVGTGGGFISKIVTGTDKRQVLPKFAWSPRGDRVAFVAQEMNASWEPVENLYVIRKNGSDLQLLFRQNAFSFRIENLKWSPDGRYVAFNANYGRPYPQADRIQRVLVVETRTDQTGSTNILDPSHLEKTNWLAGWSAPDRLLYLATVETSSLASRFEYELWQYDTKQRLRSLFLGGPVVGACRQVELVHRGTALVYTAFKPPAPEAVGLVALDLTSLNRFTLAQANPEEKLNERFWIIDRSNRIFFFLNDELHTTELGGRPVSLQVKLPERDVTFSPDGRRACFSENGLLFVSSLP